MRPGKGVADRDVGLLAIDADKVKRWRKAADAHPEARFVLLYVREAHPGAPHFALEIIVLGAEEVVVVHGAS